MEEDMKELFAIFDASPGCNELIRIGPATLDDAKQQCRSMRAKYIGRDLYLVPLPYIHVDDGGDT